MRWSVPVFALSTVVLVTSAHPALAQAPPQVELGKRVRVTAPTLGRKPRAGTLVDTVGGFWSIQVKRYQFLTVPAAEITALDVSVRHRSRVLEGAGLGFLVLAVLAAVSTEVEDQGCSDQYACGPQLVDAVAAGAGVMAGALLGAVLGGLMGAGAHADVWAPVSLEGRAGGTGGSRPAAGLRLRVPFP